MSLNIVFMGTPDFAVPCLARILKDGHRVRGVLSQPDRPRGRGYGLRPTPVKELALRHSLPVFQPESLRGPSALELLRSLAPDVAVVVAYGKLLPPALLAVPLLGCVNVHASLLPRLRGAAPIQWSVINGDRETGVTTMYLAEEMDTGDMILQRRTPIGESETAGELFSRLSSLGADCLSETLALLEAGTAPRTPQDPTLATYAPMIAKQDGALDFTLPPERLRNLVRGLNPAPCAWTRMAGKLLKVHEVRVVEGFRGEPGEILDAKRLLVACGGGAVELLRVQPEGKGVMDGAAFICGHRGAAGQKLTSV